MNYYNIARRITLSNSRPTLKSFIRKGLVFLALFLGTAITYLEGQDDFPTANKPYTISDSDALRIGQRIWKNECGGTVEGLTHWNKGEAFASMGIGHFIWYPTGTTGPFQESFPALISYLGRSGVKIPSWLADASGCPWPNRDAFLKDFDGPRLKEIRSLLKSTIPLQARFAAIRLALSFPKLMEATALENRRIVQHHITILYGHPQGLYAMMDYVNFKGEGLDPKERYQNQGWGLFQVLLNMRYSETASEAVNAFSDSAIQILQRRVSLSDPKRNEKRWLPGWTNRCRSYRVQ
ncbi:MAG: hypothetical protein AAF558_03845 [Verrucomicrobiota bacterium]